MGADTGNAPIARSHPSTETQTVTDNAADIARLFVDLVGSLSAEGGLVDAMDVIVRGATEHTQAVEAAVILATDHEAFHPVASTQERTLDVEEAQIGATAGGPCIDSIRDIRSIEVSDLNEAVEFWPEFVATAVGAGLRAVLAVPLIVDGRAIGGLNVFLRTPGRLSDDEKDFIVAMTQVVGISLQERNARRRQEALTTQLQGALDSRVVIEQAKGALAQLHNTSVGQAFMLLRNDARTRNRTLKETAQLVVRREITL
jgi:GAF domain-containing protein